MQACYHCTQRASIQHPQSVFTLASALCLLSCEHLRKAGHIRLIYGQDVPQIVDLYWPFARTENAYTPPVLVDVAPYAELSY